MIVECSKLRMAPQAAGIASGRSGDVGDTGHLCREMSCHSVRLQIERMDQVKRVLGMQPHRDARELRDEWARHRDIRLRAIDGIAPVHRHGAAAVARLAAPPVLRPHVHPKRRPHLLGIGDDVDLVSPRSQGMRRPIGAHADAALNGRKLADEADSQLRTSINPRSLRSARSLAKSGSTSSPCGSVQS